MAILNYPQEPRLCKSCRGSNFLVGFRKIGLSAYLPSSQYGSGFFQINPCKWFIFS